MTTQFSRRSFLGGALSFGALAVFLACDAQYNMPRALAGAPTNYIVDDCDLAPGAQPKFSVVALDSFGNRSAPLAV